MGIEFGSLAKDETLPPASSTDVENILASYKDAKIENTTPPPADPPLPEGVNDAPGEHATGTTGEEWRNNPAYYQTGKKAGQKRPERKGIDFTYNKDAKTEIKGSALITAAMFLTFIDIMIPLIIVGLNNWLSDTKISFSDLRMDDDVKKEINPIADATLKQLNIEGNPALLLGLMLSSTYTMNYFRARGLADEKKVVEQAEKGKTK